MELKSITKALGDPMRLEIYQQLLDRKHCVRSLSKKLGISEPAVSQHMKILREAGLVYGERFGRHVHYLPRQEAVDYLHGEVSAMKVKSLELSRDSGVCNCEFRVHADEGVSREADR